MPDKPPPETPEDSLPQEVVSRIRVAAGHSSEIPCSIDDAILADARAVLAAGKPKRRRFRGRNWTVGLLSAGSLAAALLVAVWPQWSANDQSPGVAIMNSERHVADAAESAAIVPGPVFQKEDIDQNGRVDILDAFALARHARSTPASVRGDQNGDGIVDDLDINHVAETAVLL